jgi:hypothetical protein
MNPPENSVAFGAPGIELRWTSTAKEGVGTAYHTSCRVSFTLNHGVVKEMYHPHVHQPNTRGFKFLVSDGEPSCETAITRDDALVRKRKQLNTKMRIVIYAERAVSEAN